MKASEHDRFPAAVEQLIAPESIESTPASAFLVAGQAHVDRAPRALSLTGAAPPLLAGAAPSRGRRGYDFWGLLPVTAPGSGRIAVELELGDRGSDRVPIADIAVTEPADPSPEARAAAERSGAEIAICMATFEPDLGLLARQLESIRAQSDRSWICVISDDRSSDSRFDAIRKLVADDPRFVVDRSGARLGFYRNYERALRMVPPSISLVALADQDDHWYPEKLEVLRGAIEESTLAYSDTRLVTGEGSVLANTYWTRRRNNFTDVASMVLANTVTGGASLFRRELLELALPFPPAHGGFFHDHWIAVCALAAGEIAYVDRPLYDYVQHSGAALGHARAHVWSERARSPATRLRHFRMEPTYFYDYWRDTYFLEYCRVVAFAHVVSARLGGRLAPEKRAALSPLLAGERSLRAAGWLAARAVRGVAGRNETLGAEGRLLRALAWRSLLAGSARLRRPSRWLPAGAAPTAFDPTARSSSR